MADFTRKKPHHLLSNFTVFHRKLKSFVKEYHKCGIQSKQRLKSIGLDNPKIGIDENIVQLESLNFKIVAYLSFFRLSIKKNMILKKRL